MKVRESLLASRGERRLHSSLSTTFEGTHGAFYPQVTFSELFTLSRAEVTDLAAGTISDPYGWYLQTSVDLTFCRGPAVKPLFSIEFDGITAGFSRNGRFVRGADGDVGPHREAKLDLKARIAAKVGYPLVILGWDELAVVGVDEVLTIADAIAADLLAPHVAHERIAAARRRGDIPQASSLDEARLVSALEWEIEEEVRTSLDPFHRAVGTMVNDLEAEGSIDETAELQFLPHNARYHDTDARARVGAQQAATHVSCDATVTAGRYEGRGHAKMRNIWGPLGPMEPEIERYVEMLATRGANFAVYGQPIAQHVVEKVARYLAFLDLLDRVTTAPSPDSRPRVDGR